MSSLKADLNALFAQIGAVNGQVPPEASQDPFDAIAHEFSVSQFGKSYFEKRYERAKEAVAKSLDVVAMDALRETIDRVGDNEVSENVSLMSGQFHDLTAQVKIGASYLDVAALKVELLKRMTTSEVEALISRATKRRAPSITYVVSEAID